MCVSVLACLYCVVLVLFGLVWVGLLPVGVWFGVVLSGLLQSGVVCFCVCVCVVFRRFVLLRVVMCCVVLFRDGLCCVVLWCVVVG